MADQGEDRLLTPAEVAALFRVDQKTVARWAAMKYLPSIKTPGGHRRFPESGIRALIQSSSAAGGGSPGVGPDGPATEDGAS